MRVVRRLLALLESASSVPPCFGGFDALDIAWGVPDLTGSPSLHIALATSWLTLDALRNFYPAKLAGAR